MEEINFKIDKENKYSDDTTTLDDKRKNFLLKKEESFINSNKYNEYDLFPTVDNINNTKDRLEKDKDVFNIENKKINIYNEKTDSLDAKHNYSSNENSCSINNKTIKNFSNDLQKNKKNKSRHAYIDADMHTNEYKDFYELKISDYPNRESLYVERDKLSVSAGSIAKIEEISEKNNSNFFRNIFGRRN